MRFIVGGIMHETHTFSVEATPRSAFSVSSGDEIWQFRGANHSVGGVIDDCDAKGIDLVPTLFAHATPSAPADRETFDGLIDDLVDGISAAGTADGIVLTLHGAMVAEGVLDAESEIVRRVRAAIGDTLPIAVTLDLHANVGVAMVEQSTLIVGYDTYPHVDANERAREAVGLLDRAIRGEIEPVMALVKPPLLPVPQGMYTERAPMKRLFDRAFEVERKGDALAVTIAGGFPYADVPDAGLSVLVVADSDAGAAHAFAQEIARLAWELRSDFLIENVPPAQAVSRAIDSPDAPVVLVDVGDNIGGGTPGDGTVVLRELIAQEAPESTVFLADREAVERAFAAGVGGTFQGRIGGKTDDRHGDPVEVSGYVQLLCDGEFVYQGPENAGLRASMGPTAVVRVSRVNLVLTSVKMAPGDLQQIKSVGIDPERQQIIVAKAAVRWRGGYAPVVTNSIDVDTPGLGSVDLSRFEFAHLRRPIYPLDPDTEWRPSGA